MSFLVISACTSSPRSFYRGPGEKHVIILPKDDAMHPWAHNEWWYVIGHLVDHHGRRFGFETTIFKLNHLRFPGAGQSLAVDRSDVALTDIRHRRYLHRVSYVEPGLGPTPVSLSTTSFSERVAGAKIGMSGDFIRVQSITRRSAIDLKLRPRRAALLEGGHGLVPMGPRGFSYYYSYPDLAVSGRILYRRRWLSVTGIAWLDHQWGNWSWYAVRGWTWGAFQLRNGLDFSAADFHTTGRSLRGVTVSYPHKPQRTFENVHFLPVGHWRSPRDHAVYASVWVVTIPSMKAHLRVTPLVRNQEMYDPIDPASSYWEGACSVRGTVNGRAVSGQAYMELVGASGRFGRL